MAPDRHQLKARPPDGSGGPSTLACPGGSSGGPQPDSSAPRGPVLGDDCWILAGPTAAGKTALGLLLARQLDAEILSADSMAVYRSLDIGTAKPTAAQRAQVAHHLVDLVEPGETYTVARWLAAAAAAVEDCRRRGKRVLFVGGTPLYLRALRDGLDPQPAGDPSFRRRLEEEARGTGSGPLHARLEAMDPVAAARIHPNDTRRIIRALEVVQTTGRPTPSSWFEERPPSVVFDGQMLVVDRPRSMLRERIDRRVEAMFAEGLVEETRAAASRPGGIGPTARQAAGYAEALDVLAGRMTPAEAVRLTQQRTRQLAKRQLTWLRSFKSAIWIGG
ncbi:MAG: tRNA (adenosine(37)-N6)-dimethylallyltransferase MiaA [Planctomycetia bacterium]